MAPRLLLSRRVIAAITRVNRNERHHVDHRLAGKASVRRQWIRFVRDETGQDLIEYGLLIGVITASVVTTLSAISPKVQQYYNNLNSNLST